MKSSQIVILSTLVAGFVIGVLVTVNIDNRNSTANPADEPILTHNQVNDNRQETAVRQSSEDFSKLQQLLDKETNARRLLEDKLERLSREVAVLSEKFQLARDGSGQITEIGEQANDLKLTNTWFNEQALIDSGMSSSQADELKSFFEQQEMDRMVLRDQSIREKWDRQKYLDEIQKLAEQEDTRLNQLDKTALEAYLYASGQPNRVKVTSVLASSQAGTAGIQPGDYIIRYNNERIFSGFELRAATSSGEINESIPVEVERNGEILEFYLTRGPLGIRMNSVSVAPGR